MCGISVLIRKKNQAVQLNLAKLVKEMNFAVRHRGPDGDGCFVQDGVALGHRRLSIIDLSEQAKQPMCKDGVWISYNGEIYNYKELKTELELLGHIFISASDTEVILCAWQQWGVKAFDKFNGMWAFVLLDTQQQKIIACRDHFGIKPLVYTNQHGYFAAGSEIKQFLPLPGFVPKLNHAVTYNFLQHALLNYDEATFFKEVFTVPAGHYLEYKLADDSFHTIQWYNLPQKIKKDEHNGFTAAKKKVAKLLNNSILLRMRSDVKVGSCLSGGIDSSGIVVTIYDQQLQQPDFSTLTSCYPGTIYDEQEYANEVTAYCGFNTYKTYPRLNDLFDKGDLDKMLYHLEQPVNTASHYSEFKVFELAAKQKIKVLMDGQGADEYFWGYDEFFNMYLINLIKNKLFHSAAALVRDKSIHLQKTVYKTIKSFANSNLYFPLITYIKKYIGRERANWIKKDWWDSLRVHACIMPFKRNCNEESMKQMRITSLPYQLHSADRNSMCFSVEARTPFLDHQLVEFVMGLPGNYKIAKGYSKYILREALPNLPETVRWRKHKMGFPAPDEAWVKNNPVQMRKELKAAIEGTCFFSNDLLTRYDKYVDGRLGYEPIYIRAISLHRFIKLFDIQLLI